ncbi:MAG: haloalkane dehalogenase, partial [Gammaproteobacteria bacterium]
DALPICALGFDWACANPDSVAGICYMEALVDELRWSDWPAPAIELFKAFRSDAGDALVLQDNAFIEQVFPGAILRTLDEAEMAVYRAPYRSAGEDRRPTLSWPRQLPIEGEPAAVCAMVRRYRDWMAGNALPKLFINAEPGMILTGRLRELARGWKNQQEVTVPGLHFMQEDSPDAIATAIRTWLADLP